MPDAATSAVTGTASYLGKSVAALDSKGGAMGRVVRETSNKIVVAGDGSSERYDVLKSEIQSVHNGTVTIGLPFYEIVRRYRRRGGRGRRNSAQADHSKAPALWVSSHYTDYATFAKCGAEASSVCGKRVMTIDEECLGIVASETDGAIVALGHYDFRFQIPKSAILAVTASSVMLYVDYGSAFRYRVETGPPAPVHEHARRQQASPEKDQVQDKK